MEASVLLKGKAKKANGTIRQKLVNMHKVAKYARTLLLLDASEKINSCSEQIHLSLRE